MIYLDHAATSWPKPPEVLRAMSDFLERAGGNPGRSGHRLSIEAARIVYAAREAMAELLNVPDPLRVVFTHNATLALNIALRGLLRPGDHVVTSGTEHNAVMRPLRALVREGLHLAVVPCALDGTLDPARMRQALQPGTRLVVLAGASNVTGALLPVAEVAEAAHAVGALLLVDAAPTAGAIPIDLPGQGIDLLAFTGHKALQGPPGTGGLVIGQDVRVEEISPIICGGTGSRSEFEEQPDFLPDKFESGTLNGAGIAGLGAGVRLIIARGLAAIRAREIELSRLMFAGLTSISGVKVYGPREAEKRTATLSFTIAGKTVSEAGLRLDEEYGVLARVGLHCAPAAHHTIGTFPEGTIRFSAGPMTSIEDARQAIAAVTEIART